MTDESVFNKFICLFFMMEKTLRINADVKFAHNKVHLRSIMVNAHRQDHAGMFIQKVCCQQVSLTSLFCMLPGDGSRRKDELKQLFDRLHFAI